MCIESKLDFSFYLKCKALQAWHLVKKNVKYSDFDRKFLDYIRSKLEDDPRTSQKFS